VGASSPPLAGRRGSKAKSTPATAPSAPSAAAGAPLDPRALHVAEADIAKLVPERIFSMEVHPSTCRLLALAGDTWGRVGLWDVDAPDDTSPVVTFEPHSRPVAGVRVPAAAAHLALTCSHDGAVRALDLTRGGAASFVELYRSPEDGDGDYPSLHGFSRTAGEGGVHAVGRGDGVAVLLDARVRADGAATPAMPTARLHEKKIFATDFSPARPWLLASASLDRTVALWDVRKLAGSKLMAPLATLEHGLSVTSVRFSASGARVLTTCNDDLLRVFEGDGASWALRASKKHNNKTGRYITPFQAEWLRGSDGAFVCGSLSQPRGLDVFCCDGGADYRLDDEEAVTSVVSLVAQHPTLDVLVASNSGGKCFVWR
jgi:hypothetical protein